MLERRNVYVERSQVTNLALSCGRNTTPRSRTSGRTCRLPDGFTSVNVRRRGKGLRILFARKGHRNPVRVEVFQTSKGRRSTTGPSGANHFKNRSRSFNWSGLGSKGKRLSNGVYYVRFRTLDANKRLDAVAWSWSARTGGSPRSGFYLVDRCPK